MTDPPLGPNAKTVKLDPARWEKRGERYYPKCSRTTAWGESRAVLVALKEQIEAHQGKKADLVTR